MGVSSGGRTVKVTSAVFRCVGLGLEMGVDLRLDCTSLGTDEHPLFKIKRVRKSSLRWGIVLIRADLLFIKLY
jgi:hypothetical protein